METLHKVAFIVFIMVIVILISLTGCGNRDIIHSNNTYNKAIIKMPDGIILELEIDTWSNLTDGRMRITDKNGTIYSVSAVNCVLIKEK